MISLTENAAAEIKKFMERENKSGSGLRIFVAGVSCSGPSYGIGIEEKPQEGDAVFESHGIKIFIREDMTGHLNGSVVDYKETPHGSGFVIDNPNACSSCSSSSGSCH